jgi:glycosyltransferase involved in cell wall biosynthesis
MPSVCVITPTIGRDSLRTMLDGLLPQLAEGDEVLIIGDGPRPNAQKIVDEIKSPLIRYWEIPLIRNYGNPQRNIALKEAKADYVMFVDDDDTVRPEGIKKMKKVVEKYPGLPIMFKMYHKTVEIWKAPVISCGNVSGQMFVTPNVKDKLGRWSGQYHADLDFINSTVALYPKDSLLWRYEFITNQGYAGPSPNAVILEGLR